MTPLFSPCSSCGHPAIKAARQCKRAMELANASQPDAAEELLRSALSGLRQADLPMMRAKIMNSLGLVYTQQNEHRKARRCLSLSLRIVAGHVGVDNWLYARIAGNRDRLPA